VCCIAVVTTRHVAVTPYVAMTMTEAHALQCSGVYYAFSHPKSLPSMYA
jgi:hypothetical protein